MTYQISSSTAIDLRNYMREGIALWNAIEMCTFNFVDGGITTATNVANDSVNLISIDPDFSHGSSILAISSTWSSGSGSNYRAVESDIIFNGNNFTWGDGSGGTNDTKAVVAHETGHNAGLSHPGSTCRSPGSSGCGAEVPKATMYWNYSGGQPTNKGTLELDDVAGLIYGYPRSTFGVKVVDHLNQPVEGAVVELLDAAAPVNGNSIASGGKVYGDVTNPNVLLGDKATSDSYVNQTPFNLTSSQGLTNTIFPTRRTIRIKASHGGKTKTVSHTLVDGASTLTVALPNTENDNTAPSLNITSHASGTTVASTPVTISGTATDHSRGNSGIQKVTVNGQSASGGSASGAGTANWSASVALTNGTNTITVIAKDDASAHNATTKTIAITLDTSTPTVVDKSPAANAQSVATNSVITARFNKAMKASTINTNTFTISTGFSARVSYDTTTRTATFTPSGNLAYGTTYTITLTTGIQSESGVPLESPHTWQFTTTQAPASFSGSGGSSGGCFIDSLPL